MSEPRVIVPSEPRYQNFLSPDYPVQFLDDQGQPIPLTSVNVSSGFTFVLQSIGYSPMFITCTGDWSITDAANGKATFSFGLDDLAVIALFAVYITVQLPNESTPRAFSFNTLSVLEWDGGPIVVTQVDIEKLNGAPIGSGNAFPISGPVTLVDGGSVTLGAKADASYTGGGGSASLVSLLRGIFDQTKQAVTQRALIAPWSSNPAQTAGSAADTQYKFGSLGTTTVLAILLQNKTGADLRFAVDAASSANTFVLADGQFIYIDTGAPITVLHLSSAAQQYVNSSSNVGVFFQAWG